MNPKIFFLSATFLTLSAMAADKYNTQMGGYPSNPNGQLTVEGQCDLQFGTFEDRQQIDFSNVPNMQPIVNLPNYQTHDVSKKPKPMSVQMGDNYPQSYYQAQRGYPVQDQTSETSDGQMR